jgi:hypothetical protein
MYEGRLDDATKLMRGQIAAAAARHGSETGENEYEALARILLRRHDKPGALTAARAALRGEGVRLLYDVAMISAEAGDASVASRFAREWADNPSPEWRSYAKLAEGDADRARGALRDAETAYLSASKFGDGWRAHERLGALLVAEGRWAEADEALSYCMARRGMGAVVGTPSLQLLPSVYYGLARAKEGEKSPDAAKAYQDVVALGPAAQGDPLTDDARRRLASLQRE